MTRGCLERRNEEARRGVPQDSADDGVDDMPEKRSGSSRYRTCSARGPRRNARKRRRPTGSPSKPLLSQAASLLLGWCHQQV